MTKDERREKFLLEHPEYIIRPKVKHIRVKKERKKREYIKKEVLAKICKVCGIDYMPNSTYQKYCSKKCFKRNRLLSPKEKFKQWARWRVWFSIDRGIITKPCNCENCGLELPLQGHHEDYSKPLDVIWLCRQCHTVADKLLRSFD